MFACLTSCSGSKASVGIGYFPYSIPILNFIFIIEALNLHVKFAFFHLLTFFNNYSFKLVTNFLFLFKFSYAMLVLHSVTK